MVKSCSVCYVICAQCTFKIPAACFSLFLRTKNLKSGYNRRANKWEVLYCRFLLNMLVFKFVRKCPLHRQTDLDVKVILKWNLIMFRLSAIDWTENSACLKSDCFSRHSEYPGISSCARCSWSGGCTQCSQRC